MPRRLPACLGLVMLWALSPAVEAQKKPLLSADSTEMAAGKRLFDAQCAWCHGAEGTGGMGPTLQRSSLRHARTDDELVSIVRNGIPGTEMPAFIWSLTDAMAWRTAAYVRSLGRSTGDPPPGNRDRGASVYDARGCQSCHIVAGRGTAVGPDLSAIGALRGVSYLRDAIVKPEAAHPRGYLVVRAVRRSGPEIRGIRVDEDVFWVHLRDAAGTLHVLEKTELASLDRELKGTLMPSYASVLAAGELDDLVAYLASLRGDR